MAYTPTVWADDGAPAVSAANLNKIEDGLEKAVGYNTLALMTAAGDPSSSTDAVINGRDAVLDGGEGRFSYNAAATDTVNTGTIVIPDGHVGAGRWKRHIVNGMLPLKAFAAGKAGGSFDCTQEVNDWLGECQTNGYVAILDGKYLCTGALDAITVPILLRGTGWHYDTAEVTAEARMQGACLLLETSAYLKVTLGVDDTSYDSGMGMADFGIVSEHATKYAIDSEGGIRCGYDNLYIDLNNTGLGGLYLHGDSFFSHARRVSIQRYKEFGGLVDGRGFAHSFEHCHMATTDAAATAALEIRRPSATVVGGQYDTNNAAGIGIRFNNTGASVQRGGQVINTGHEASDVAIEITGTTQSFHDVVVQQPRILMTGHTTGIKFDRAAYCKAVDPNYVFQSGVDIAEWTANAVECSVEASYGRIANGTITVNASATRPLLKVRGAMAYGSLGDLPTDSNMTVICEEVDNHRGAMRHNGTGWDKGRVSIADDAAAIIPIPRSPGLFKWRISNSRNGSGIIDYVTAAATPVALAVGSDVNLTNGILSGTTGTDVKITVSVHSDGNIYIENRLGSTGVVSWSFEELH